MALGTPTHRAQGAALSAATAVNTTSFTIPAGDTCFVYASMMRHATQSALSTISDTAGLAWTQIGAGEIAYDPGGNPRFLGQLWYYKNNTGSGITTTVTATAAQSGTQNMGIHALTISGDVSTDFSNRAIATAASGGDATVTLPTVPAITSCGLGWFMCSGGPTVDKPAGTDAEITEFFTGASSQRPLECAFGNSPAPQSWPWVTAGAAVLAFAIEVKDSTAGGSDELLAGTGAASFAGAVSLAADRALSGTGTVGLSSTTTLQADRRVAGAGSSSFGGAGALSADRGLAGSGTAILVGSSGLAADRGLGSTATVTFGGAASLDVLTESSDLSGSGSVGFTASSGLSVDHAFAGSGLIEVSASALLTTDRDFAGTGSLALDGSAILRSGPLVPTPASRTTGAPARLSMSSASALIRTTFAPRRLRG